MQCYLKSEVGNEELLMCYHAVDPHYRAWPVSYDVTPVYQNLFESVKPFIIFRKPLNPTDGRKDQRTNKLISKYFLKFVCGGIIIVVHNSDRIMVCYEYRYFLCLHWTLIKQEGPEGPGSLTWGKGQRSNGANNREPHGHNLNNFGRGPFDNVIY